MDQSPVSLWISFSGDKRDEETEIICSPRSRYEYPRLPSNHISPRALSGSSVVVNVCHISGITRVNVSAALGVMQDAGCKLGGSSELLCGGSEKR